MSATRSTMASAGLVVLVLLLLGPLAGKAVHVDDPLFIWTARQIVAHPLDPYGFGVNWYERESPMHEVTKNPPLAAYLMALVGGLLGWDEIVLHLAFLVPAVLAVLGVARLAREIGAPPALAAALTAVTPAFLVSASTLMSDTLLLAFWVWAVALWVHGIERDRLPPLVGAAVLSGGALLTKYFGTSLIVLLLAWTVARRPGRPRRLLLLVLPLLVAGCYELATLALYGRGLLGDAGSYALAFRSDEPGGVLRPVALALTFTGASVAAIAAYAPWLWPRRALGVALGLGAVGALALPAVGAVSPGMLATGGGVRWSLLAQAGLWGVVGVGALALALAELRERRDRFSTLLGLWLVGTVLFGAALNWTVNARTLLPMVPAAALLVARRLDARGALSGALRGWRHVLPLVPGAALALVVAWADHGLAASAREAARLVATRVPAAPTAAVWFSGHWGFQYYAERTGARPLDIRRSRVAAGDLVVIPENSTNPLVPPAGALALREIIEPAGASRLVATMDHRVGAGFYSAVFGPIPFFLGAVPPQRYFVLEARRDLGAP